jgi:hypothetical protein
MTEVKKPAVIAWVKKDGKEMQTNDAPATIKAAEDLGWKRKKGRPSQANG